MEMPVTARNPLLATLSKRLDERRHRHAIWLLQFRVVACTLTFALESWRATEVPGMAPALAMFGVWAVAGVVLWLLAGRVALLLRHYWLTFVLLDLPLGFVAVYMLIAVAPVPTRVTALLCSALIVLVVLTAAALSRSAVIAVAIVGGLMLIALNLRASTPTSVTALEVFALLCGAFCADFVIRQLLGLVGQVARDELIRERMGRYFSPAVREGFEVHGAPPSFAAHQHITVLFCDLRGFTRISESLPAPEVAALLDGYLAKMVRIIFRHGGTLDKFMGDGILAYFGAPVAQPDQAARAVECAMEMATALDEINLPRGEQNEAPLRIGVGVHSGPAFVGDIGPEERREFTVIGDTVNVASRIEGLTKEHGVDVLVSETTRAAASDRFDWREAPTLPIRGRATSVRTFVPARRAVDGAAAAEG
jgi:class 3 adenylate cyclase